MVDLFGFLMDRRLMVRDFLEYGHFLSTHRHNTVIEKDNVNQVSSLFILQTSLIIYNHIWQYLQCSYTRSFLDKTRSNFTDSQNQIIVKAPWKNRLFLDLVSSDVWLTTIVIHWIR